MDRDMIKLESGSRVAIIGGGPAGVFCALFLRKFGLEAGIHPEITIFQNRDFLEQGPKGCKGCAGIVSNSLIENMRELDLELPEEVIRNRLEGYIMHSPYTSILIGRPASEKEIVTVYRGSGPANTHKTRIHGFDDWLLSNVREKGIDVQEATVSSVDLKYHAHPRLEIDNQVEKYDLVIMASGLSKQLYINGMDYIPPASQVMAVDELYAGEDAVREKLGNSAHGFLIPQLGIVFAGLIPKGPFITVTVLSTRNPPVTIRDFLTYDLVREVLPEKYQRVCGCRPRAVTGYARNFMADRFISIGDAAVSKLYQEGMNSAFITGRSAAYTAIYHGIAEEDFKKYYMPAFTQIKRENFWGHTLFSVNNLAKNSEAFLLAQYRLTSIEQNNTSRPQPFTKAAWGMLTGSYDYGDVLKGLLKPIPVLRLVREFVAEVITRRFVRKKSAPRKLFVGARKVVILGSGFAGINVLRNLVPALNKNENIETTMISNENYTLFTPLLHEVALGRIDPRNIAYPIRSLNWRDRFSFIRADVENIDLNEKKIYAGQKTFDYDFLVLALGSDSNVDWPGTSSKNIFTLKTLDDAISLRNHLISVFEKANLEPDPEKQQELLTFVVSGAGYTGVQVVTGLCDLVCSMPKYYKTINTNNVKVILVEIAPKIVSELDNKVGNYIMQYLLDHGIDVRLNSQITDVTEDNVKMDNGDVIPTNTVIWVPGVKVNDKIAELEITKDYRNRIYVNDYMELPQHPGVYAAGDCVNFRNPRSGRPLPPLARTAVSQAKVVAQNILADIRGQNRKRYKFFRYWDVVNLGSNKAAFRFRFVRLYGYLPRLLMMSAYFFLISGGANRIRLVIDWILSLLFGRDTTYLRYIREDNEMKQT